MRKWKFLAAGLVLVILILCMMTFLLNGKYRNLQIQVNRMDREHEDLKRDYEKLYVAYYDYEKKVLKLLEGRNDVIWAEDSSAYVIKAEKKYWFGFYKKPRMQEEFFVWWREWHTMADGTYPSYLYSRSNRVDTLKPHQLIELDFPEKEKTALVVGNGTDEAFPHEVLEIQLK